MSDQPEKDAEMQDISEDNKGMSEVEEEKDEKLKALDKAIKDSASNLNMHFNAHMSKVNYLKTKEDHRVKMRAAREAFAKACPLSPKIWVDWITEERKHVETDDDKAFIFHLYQRALADFQSVDLWRNYLNCTSKEMDKMDVEAKREIFEQAVSTMGLHLTKGAKLWELYRQFELSVLSPEADLQAKERIDQLFRRRLAVPLVGMEKTMAAYLEFLGKDGSINAKLMTDYNKALEMLKARETMETTIKDYASRIKTDIFDKYIALEKSEGGEGSHQRICVLFERQVIDADFSRTPESIGWIKYLDYLDKVPNAGKQYLAVYKRALRNHPNNPSICFNYMAALEAAGEPMEKITEAFEWLKSMNFTEATKYTELWMAYIECYHRNTVFTNEDGSVNQEKAEEFRGIFKSAHEFLSAKEGADPQKTVLRYWAQAEARVLKNYHEASELWFTKISAKFSMGVKMWLEYAQLEGEFGKVENQRRILKRAHESVKPDGIADIADAWLTFERFNGDSASLKLAKSKIDFRRKNMCKDKGGDKNVERKRERYQVEPKGGAKNQAQSRTRNYQQQQNYGRQQQQMGFGGYGSYGIGEEELQMMENHDGHYMGSNYGAMGNDRWSQNSLFGSYGGGGQDSLMGNYGGGNRGGGGQQSLMGNFGGNPQLSNRTMRSQQHTASYMKNYGDQLRSYGGGGLLGDYNEQNLKRRMGQQQQSGGPQQQGGFKQRRT